MINRAARPSDTKVKFPIGLPFRSVASKRSAIDKYFAVPAPCPSACTALVESRSAVLGNLMFAGRAPRSSAVVPSFDPDATAVSQRQGRNSGVSTPGIWTVSPSDRKARSNCNRKSSRTTVSPATNWSRFLQPADLSILTASRMRPVRTMETNSFRALSCKSDGSTS